MTASQVLSGILVFRQWDRARGLQETLQPFHTLDELYALCLAADAPDMIDRIVVQGLDTDEQPRTLTFVFQSITVSPKRPI